MARIYTYSVDLIVSAAILKYMDLLKHFQTAKCLDHCSEQVNPLSVSIIRGRVESTRLLLLHGADPNRFVDGSKINAFHIVCRFELDLVKLFVEFGANANLEDQNGLPPIHHVIKPTLDDPQLSRFGIYMSRRDSGADVKVFEYVLDQCIDVDVVDGNMTTSLMLACRDRYTMECVKLLVNRGANIHLVDKHGRTALMYAAAGHGSVRRFWTSDSSISHLITTCPSHHVSSFDDTIKLIQYLVEAGADIHVKLHQGLTVLHFVATCEYAPSNPFPFFVKQGVDINLKDNFGKTPRHYAASLEYHRADLCKSLLNLRPDINSTDNDGRTPLMLVVSHEMKRNVTLLIEHGADVNLTDKQGQTALSITSRIGKQEIIELFQNIGAKTSSVDADGVPSILGMFAAGDVRMVEYHIKNGDDPEVIDKNGKNALMYAAENSITESIKMALDYRDVNAVDNDRMTAMMHAAKHDRKCWIQLFLNNKADIEAVNNDGHTALIVGLAHSRNGFAISPIKKGANVNYVTPQTGMTILMYAAQSSTANAVESLLSQNVDVNAQDNSGKTALMHLVNNKTNITQTLRIAELLGENSAQLCIVDNKGNSP